MSYFGMFQLIIQNNLLVSINITENKKTKERAQAFNKCVAAKHNLVAFSDRKMQLGCV